MEIDQGKYQNADHVEDALLQGNYGGNETVKTWTCPSCETINTEDTCFLCGYRNKPTEPAITRKKKKHTMAIAVAIVLLLITCKWLVNRYQTTEKYERACSYLEQQQYSEACELFAGLKEYRDSQEKLLQAKYEWAISELNLSNFAEAQKLFLDLGNYLDSEQQVIYTSALQLEKENKFSDAIKEMERIPEHPQLKEILNRLNYAYAKQFWQNKEYSHAYSILLALGDYLDSTELLPKLTLDWADHLNRFSLNKSVFFNMVCLDEVWDDPLIQHTVASAPFDWFRGAWNSENGDYVIVPVDLGEVQYSFRVERDINRYSSYGYSYSHDYETNTCTGEFYWHAPAYNEDLKVFRFKPIGPDIAEVYCYADRKTYTMYRYRQ